jgi:hypothetical protein
MNHFMEKELRTSACKTIPSGNPVKWLLEVMSGWGYSSFRLPSIKRYIYIF